MKIGEMRNDGNFVMLIEHDDTPGGFWISVPKHVAKKLDRNDVITAVCVLTPNMEFATETLALKKNTGEHYASVIFDRSGHWEKLIGL